MGIFIDTIILITTEDQLVKINFGNLRLSNLTTDLLLFVDVYLKNFQLTIIQYINIVPTIALVFEYCTYVLVPTCEQTYVSTNLSLGVPVEL